MTASHAPTQTHIHCVKGELHFTLLPVPLLAAFLALPDFFLALALDGSKAGGASGTAAELCTAKAAHITQVDTCSVDAGIHWLYIAI